MPGLQEYRVITPLGRFAPILYKQTVGSDLERFICEIEIEIEIEK
jgi:hypothetical protein